MSITVVDYIQESREVWDADSRTYTVYSDPPPASGDRFCDGYVEACKEILRSVFDSPADHSERISVRIAVVNGLERFGLRDVSVDARGNLCYSR